MTKSSLSGLLFRMKSSVWRYKAIQENRRGKILLKKLITVFLWLILAAGIYWCNVSTQDKKEQERVEEDDTVKPKEAVKEREGETAQTEEISRTDAPSDTISM